MDNAVQSMVRKKGGVGLRSKPALKQGLKSSWADVDVTVKTQNDPV
jgi:hypothetical protein